MQLQVKEKADGSGYKQVDQLQFEAFMGTKAVQASPHLPRRVYCSKVRGTTITKKSSCPCAVHPTNKNYLRFHIKINWSGETHELWNWATSQEQAFIKAIKRLSPVLRYTPNYIKIRLQSTPQSWEVVHE